MSPYTYLDERNNPHVLFGVLLGKWVQIDCIIDTGFSGGIALPRAFEKYIRQKPVLYQQYELADGSLTAFPLHEVKIKYKAIKKDVTLLFTNSSEGLIGIEFLIGLKFTLDLKRNSISLE